MWIGISFAFPLAYVSWYAPAVRLFGLFFLFFRRMVCFPLSHPAGVCLLLDSVHVVLSPDEHALLESIDSTSFGYTNRTTRHG